MTHKSTEIFKKILKTIFIIKKKKHKKKKKKKKEKKKTRKNRAKIQKDIADITPETTTAKEFY